MTTQPPTEGYTITAEGTGLPATMLAVPSLDWRVTSYSGHSAHDGICYRATLAYQGKPVGTIENGGDGGSTTVWIGGFAGGNAGLRDTWVRFCAAVPLATIDTLFGTLTVDPFPGETPASRAAVHEECVAELLVEEYQTRKRFDGLLKRGSTVYLKPGESLFPGGAFRIVRAPLAACTDFLHKQGDGTHIWTARGWVIGADLLAGRQ